MTVPSHKMHNVRSVPTFKIHNIGTVPMFKMHNVGAHKMYDLCLELELGMYSKNKSLPFAYFCFTLVNKDPFFLASLPLLNSINCMDKECTFQKLSFENRDVGLSILSIFACTVQFSDLLFCSQTNPFCIQIQWALVWHFRKYGTACF